MLPLPFCVGFQDDSLLLLCKTLCVKEHQIKSFTCAEFNPTVTFFSALLRKRPGVSELVENHVRFDWRQRRHDLCRVGTYLCFASLPIVAPSCHHPKGNTVNSDFSARSLTVGKQQMCGAAANVVTRWVEVVKSVPNEVYPALVLVKRWALV